MVETSGFQSEGHLPGGGAREAPGGHLWKTYIAEIIAINIWVAHRSESTVFLVKRPKVRGEKKSVPVSQCVICKEVLANDSTRPYKPRCRCESNHPRLVAKPVESSLIVFIKVIKSLSILNTKPPKRLQGWCICVSTLKTCGLDCFLNFYPCVCFMIQSFLLCFVCNHLLWWMQNPFSSVLH